MGFALQLVPLWLAISYVWVEGDCSGICDGVYHCYENLLVTHWGL